jgi:hypothetical protein
MTRQGLQRCGFPYLGIGLAYVRQIQGAELGKLHTEDPTVQAAGKPASLLGNDELSQKKHVIDVTRSTCRPVRIRTCLVDGTPESTNEAAAAACVMDLSPRLQAQPTSESFY